MSLMLAGGMAALSFASSMMGSADENDKMLSQARAYGVKTAGISFGATRRQSILVSQAGAIVENARIAEMSVDKAQASKEAMIRVQAALTGVGGDSVDDTISQTEIDASEAKYNIDNQKTGQLNQKKIDFVDTAINADISKGYQDTTTRDSGADILTAGFGALQSYTQFGGTFGGSGGSGSEDWSVFGGGEEWNF